ncbi:MAG: caspase family protein [Candidatus Cloacimonadaceae bacterium]|jgi:hypothetical protein|nr:caspase family protein [Candidatus Cloacimonadota bacterium]MDX9950292.1 caspase family protein [Candidatus Syntrophosphaera sp.]
MRRKILGLLLILFVASALEASFLEEARALKSWLDVPFNTTALDSERDARLKDFQSPVKDEFETTAQFEERKKNIENQKKAIVAEYEHKKRDALAAHENQRAKMLSRFHALLQQSREDVVVEGTLGNYNADTQKFKLSTPERSYEIVVPLDKGKLVKDNFSRYEVRVTRQLNENLQWSYLEARISGPAGIFSSTNKAPALVGSGQIASLVPPDLTASVSFSEPSGNDMLDAEETATVTITIQNRGEGSAQMVEAKFDLGNLSGVSHPGSVYFGEINPGASVSKEVKLVAGMEIQNAQARLKIDFHEQYGFPPDDKIISFYTRALQPPELYIADIGIADYNKNGKIEPGETVEIRVRVHNRGQGQAKNVIARIIRGEKVYFTGENPTDTYNLGNMDAGEYKDVVFDILTAKTATQLDLKLELKESLGRYGMDEQPLNLAFNRVERTADQMVVLGKESNAIISLAPALSVDVEQDIPALGSQKKNRWGVIIGIENYRNVPRADFARRDAEFMKEYFTKVLGIPLANIYVKNDDDATLGELQAVFNPKGWLDKNANKKGNEIFIYYSGHGAPSMDGGEAYLLPQDGNPNYAENTGISLQELYVNLGNLKSSEVTLFLDSCFSGGDRTSESILAMAKPVFLSPELPAVAPNVTVFSAASGNQIASSYPDMQHGLFTYYLMKGLRGEADTNGDRKITQLELNLYLGEHVGSMARRLGREQDPQLQSGDHNKVLLQW